MSKPPLARKRRPPKPRPDPPMKRSRTSPRPIVVVGFTENAWARDAAKFAATIERIAARKFTDRATAIGYCFFQSASGRRLRSAFGDHLADLIRWENVTPCVGSKGSEKFPVDLDHVRRVLAAHRPDLVLTFGIPARQALAAAWSGQIVNCPHPSPLNTKAPVALRELRTRINAAIARIRRRRRRRD